MQRTSELKAYRLAKLLDVVNVVEKVNGVVGLALGVVSLAVFTLVDSGLGVLVLCACAGLWVLVQLAANATAHLITRAARKL